jgi:proteasome lid subunit RPN8/RPN11
MLYLPQECLETLRLHVEESYPHEGCGILLGRREQERELVTRVVATANASSEPWHRFAIPPEALIAAQKLAREEGVEILGFFHSHPDRTAEPSDLDLRQAELRGELIAIGGARLIERRRWEAIAVEPSVPFPENHPEPEKIAAD